MKLVDSVCVFCGSSDTIAEPYLQAARSVGSAVAQLGLTLVFGGGGTGLMGALADAALEGNAKVIGIIPQMFDTPALVHPSVTEMHVVGNMHDRKALMIEAADAFIALPGGFGTYDELFEVLTWAQVGLHSKPVGVLNACGYFDPLLSLIEQARLEGFIYDEHRSLLLCDSQPEALLKQLSSYRPPRGLERWVDRV